MQATDFQIVDQIITEVATSRTLNADEDKVQKKIKLIVKQLEVQENASTELDKIRQDLNELNK